MRRNRMPAPLLAGVTLASFLLGAVPAVAQSDSSKPGKSVLFEHVNVVPMDTERVLPDEAVLVQGGTIRAIAKRIEVPPGTEVVDGHGTEYLSPGLADMHVHSDTRRDMILFLANGVTTILNMGHARAGFVDSTRPALNRGELPGPHVYVAFMVDGSPEYNEFFVRTPAEARAVVQLAKTNGYDFVKVYNNLSPECFHALAEEGRTLGMPLVGHGVTQVGIEKQLAAGQMMVAHAEEYLYTVFKYPTADPGTAAPTVDQIPGAVAFTKKDGAYVTADLNTYATIARQWGKLEQLDRLLASPEVRFLDPDDRLAWRASSYVKRNGDLSARVEFLKKFILALNQAGVPLLAGTDSPPIPGLVPGFALHQDLQALQQAGLSPFAVLSTATRTPGEFIAKAKPGEQHFGTVAVGNRADLVLTSGNPLEDLSTLRTPRGVMADGHWYSASELNSLLEGVAEQYQKVLQR